MARELEDRVQMLEMEVETMMGIIAGVTTILTSMIAKHPSHEQLQLHIASLVEIADAGAMGPTLNQKQRDTLRAYVEQLQQTRAAPAEIRPLG